MIFINTPRSVLKIQPNMYDSVFCKNSERLKPLTIFAKSSTLYVRLGKEFVSVIHINTIFENNLIIL